MTMSTTLLAGDAPRQHRDSAAGGSAPADPSFRPLLAPRSVAVAGDLQQHGHAGYEMLRSLRDYGFRGRLYPVHDSGRPVCGIPGYRTVAELPEPADLIVLATEAGRTPEVIRAAGRRGIPCAVLLNSADGRRHHEVLQAARDHSVLIAGPGSFGVLNTDVRVRLNATLTRTRPPRGGLALASQSSAVGVALLEHVARDGCGVASFVSAGDDLDLGNAGLIDYWYRDAHTRAVAVFPDSPADHRRFAQAARSLARRKPVLLIGSGHPDSVVADPLVTEAGMVCTTSLDEMTDAARMLVNQPLPAGDRLGVVGNAGALTTITGGTAKAYGFVVPAGCTIDLGAEAGPAEIALSVEELTATGMVDIVVVVVVGSRSNCPAAIMTAIAGVLDRRPGLTAAAVLAGTPDDVHRVGLRDTPVYRQQDRALRALSHAHRYARWRGRDSRPR
ncbi:CoA-binding protein [Actinoplanes solisilvae]|uniref:CoA-binding protein n=1 Tax=Actinoplanes solisilvae TaxID=2486853 RepID=UPI000FDA793A|nr:CoA-binding protein [Actinoplanes solisilvae]